MAQTFNNETLELPEGDAVADDVVVVTPAEVMAAIEAQCGLEEFTADVSRVSRGPFQDKRVGKIDIHMMDPRDLTIVPMFNPRLPGPKLRAHIDRLKYLIREHGYISSKVITVLGQRIDANTVEFWVTDGICRVTAMLELIAEGYDIRAAVPVSSEPEGVTIEDITARIFVHNNETKELDRLEVGIMIKRLLSYGWTMDTIARKMSKVDQKTSKPKIAWVKDTLLLVGAPEQIRGRIIDGTLSETLALQMIKQHGASAVALLEVAESAAEVVGKPKVTQKTIEAQSPAVARRRIAGKFTDRMHSEIQHAASAYRALHEVASSSEMEKLSDDARAVIVMALEGFKELSKIADDIEAGTQAFIAKHAGLSQTNNEIPETEVVGVDPDAAVSATHSPSSSTP